MKLQYIYKFLPFLVFIGLHTAVNAQVSIAPTSIFLNEQVPFANLLVSNGSNTAQEISISFRFGYSDNDEQGNVIINYDSTSDPLSLNENVNAFPRNFVLPAGERQTVRLTATGLGSRENGTYWTRVSVLASPLSPPIESIQEGAVAAQININFEQIIPIYYQKGTVSTGLDVRGVTFSANGDQGQLMFDLTRTGNSPFLGNVTVRVLNSNGNQVLQETANITAYYSIVRGLSFDISDLDPGNYTAEYTFRSERRDIASRNMIQITPIQQTTSFTIE